jgi:hypothetical protein
MTIYLKNTSKYDNLFDEKIIKTVEHFSTKYNFNKNEAFEFLISIGDSCDNNKTKNICEDSDSDEEYNSSYEDEKYITWNVELGSTECITDMNIHNLDYKFKYYNKYAHVFFKKLNYLCGHYGCSSLNVKGIFNKNRKFLITHVNNKKLDDYDFELIEDCGLSESIDPNFVL